MSLPEIFNVAQIKQSSGAWPPLDDSLNDEARVPSRGSRSDQSLALPDYRPKGYRKPHFTPVRSVGLTIIHAISALEKNCSLARCVLFETVRTQRPLLALGRLRGLRLTGGPRYLDMALSELLELVQQGFDLIEHDDREIQQEVLGSPGFQKECASSKKTILDLEKDFDDNVFKKLQQGMADSAEDIDYEQLIDRLREVWCSLKLVYDRITNTYYQMFKEERNRRRRGDNRTGPPVPDTPDRLVGPNP